MRHIRPILMTITGSVLAIFACVTINIYFPAEQVESVAGEIVDEIRGKEGEPGEKSGTPDDRSQLLKTFLALSRSVAWAEEIITVSNPTIRALKERMKDRFTKMKPLFQSGALKEGDDGYVVTGNTEGLGLKDKRDLNNLVDAENQDRKSLYQEVAKAMKIDPGQIDKIAEIFAEEWKKSLR
jgi:uncharacterized protein YdbL (DUF1318 family)